MSATYKATACAIVAGAVSAFAGQALAADSPDLVIRDIQLQATGKCGVGQPIVRGFVIVKNVGKKRAPALLRPLITVYDKNQKDLRDPDVKINSLAPGETQRAIVRIGLIRKITGVTGNRTFIAIADPDNLIKEDNEKNNSFKVTVKGVNCAGEKITKDTAAAEALPDLVIRKVNLEATGKCGLGTPVVKGTVTIKNVGKGKAKALFFSPLIKAFDVGRPDLDDPDTKINALEPGEEVTANVNISMFKPVKGIPKSTRVYEVQADPNDKIEESNELNNNFRVKVKGVDCP